MKIFTVSIRPLIITTYLLGFVFLQSHAAEQKGLSSNPAKPNIIYIMVDDLGYGDLGCFGQKILKTPRIDKLASQGIRLTDHYAGNPVCRPSRLVLWTGMDPRHSPIRGNANYAFQNTETTVATLLKAGGYATGGVGKWALANADSGHPNDNGFDFWMGYMDQSLAHNHFPLHLWRNREKVPLPGNELYPVDSTSLGRVSEVRKTFAHDVMTEEALSYIRDNVGQPFLLHVHWTIPHANNEGGRLLGDGMEVPDYGEYSNMDWPDPEKGFASMVTIMDRDVGRILDLLDELKIADNTIVIFTSDNGPHEEGGHKHDFFDSNGPLRGYKRDLYEGGIRVPTIARWPGHIKAGSSSDYPSAFWDYLPTACDIAGVPIPEFTDGVSYLPVLLGKKTPSKRAMHWIYSTGVSSAGKLALRYGKWKAVKIDENTPWELYNLSKDLGEANDLAARKPATLAKLLARFEEEN